mmetsp:Transcript_19229/g.61066  ORF Transcript_19229/g.61066 Transcript_19229/m.61066 type:complete len:200 (-) Transcript_19229:1273-1872(-)
MQATPRALALRKPPPPGKGARSGRTAHGGLPAGTRARPQQAAGAGCRPRPAAARAALSAATCRCDWGTAGMGSSPGRGSLVMPHRVQPTSRPPPGRAARPDRTSHAVLAARRSPCLAAPQVEAAGPGPDKWPPKHCCPKPRQRSGTAGTGLPWGTGILAATSMTHRRGQPPPRRGARPGRTARDPPAARGSGPARLPRW